MGESDKNKHMGLLFQVNFSFQGHAFQCLFSQETDGMAGSMSVGYRAVILNEDNVDAVEFLNMFLTSIGDGLLPPLPITLPSLDSFMVEYEETDKPAAVGEKAQALQHMGLTKIHMGVGSGGQGRKPLVNLDFYLRNKTLAFLLKFAMPIQLSKIPLAEDVFQEKDGISKITIAWIQGKKGEDTQRQQPIRK